MHTLKVDLGKRSYNIIIGRDIIGSLGNYIRRLDVGNSAYIITNPLVKSMCGLKLARVLEDAGFSTKVRVIPDTEKSKSIAMLSSVISDLAKFDLDKRTFVIALGGGVVGDLSGLVASIYKRGIAHIQIPTTLLAQVDSAIGGKTAVDLKEGKNLVGAFYQPRLVYSDIALLKSLDPRQLRTGLAEVIKYGLIKDTHLFNYLEKNYREILGRKVAALEYIVRLSSRIKADIVQADEKEEKGIRTILNFGHTVGHALEAASGFSKYTHGEAVALGMLVAAQISMRLGRINPELNARISSLIERIGLPTRIDKIALKDIIKAYHRDKKFIGAKNRLVLLKALGKTEIVENVPLVIIEEAIKNRIR